MSNRLALIAGAAVMVFVAWLLVRTAGVMSDFFWLGAIVTGVLIVISLVRPPRRRRVPPA